MNKVKAFCNRHRAKVTTALMTGAMMLPSAFAAEGDFDIAGVMGTATTGIVAQIQQTVSVVVPIALPVIGIFIVIRVGKGLIKSLTGGR